MEFLYQQCFLCVIYFMLPSAVSGVVLQDFFSDTMHVFFFSWCLSSLGLLSHAVLPVLWWLGPWGALENNAEGRSSWRTDPLLLWLKVLRPVITSQHRDWLTEAQAFDWLCMRDALCVSLWGRITRPFCESKALEGSRHLGSC